MKRTRQRSMANAVEFLKLNGGDPDRWAMLERARRRKPPKEQRDIERLAAETMRYLDRTRSTTVVDTFGPPRP
jgi:hypothetical protein